MGRVQDKVAIITGAASGLGFAAARMLLKEGAKVVLTDVNREVLDSMPDRLNDFSQSQFQTSFHDVTQEDSWVELINKTENDQGKINILVNSAGISLGADVVSTDFDIWKKVHQVNLDSVFLGCKYAVPIMGKYGHGSIINISSIEAKQPARGHAHYSVSKSALEALTKASATELGSLGIRVNGIAPGLIERDGIKVDWPEGVSLWEDNSPLGKLVDPEDVSSASVFLASDKAKSITGSILTIDCGLTATPSW